MGRDRKKRAQRGAGSEAKPPGETSAAYSYEDRAAFNQAFAGVRPLGGGSGARRVGQAVRSGPDEADLESIGLTPADTREADEEARRRLASLVGRGIRFEVDRDGPFIRAARLGADPRIMRMLGGRLPEPEASLDLHGRTTDELDRAVGKFLRRSRERGQRAVLIIHGKGLHSADGAGVLRDRLVQVLMDGSGAAHVLGFATASPRHGGTGAILILLAR